MNVGGMLGLCSNQARRASVEHLRRHALNFRQQPRHHVCQRQHLCQLQHFSTTSYHGSFQILGIPSNSSTDDIKKAFLKQAMRVHPDRGGNVKEFVRLRSAFEHIMGTDSEQTANSGTNYNWQDWFSRETGLDMAFEMNESTRREVIDAYKKLAKGGKTPKGGYWELARVMAEHEENNGPRRGPGPVLQLSASNNNDGSMRRPRRR
mmetsp:Transcript_27871/g.76717  ORF Transcript_27871/g.76717 Transcript_27871/m.76717 type:complete len:206 (-) Transcript_27871:35-652(-)